MHLTVGSVTIDADAATTRAVYATIDAGGADTCSCATCRNWVTIRDRALPAGIIAILDRLGVDHRKDEEVVHYTRRDDGMHMYDGWYHAIGVMLPPGACERIVVDGVELVIETSDGSDLFFDELRPYPLVRIGFVGHFPWAIDAADEPM